MALKEFTLNTPRPLPVIVLADTSGSMGINGKIDALNAALRDMMESFSQEARLRADIQVAVVTFGKEVKVHVPLQSAHDQPQVPEMVASGHTPMGEAFDVARELLEDKETIPSRAYRPTIVLISDGYPTDTWEIPFEQLKNSERAQKAMRFAMAIGDDADEGMLKDFVNDVEAPVFKAHNGRDIHRFFRAVTMSVSTRSQNTDPDKQQALLLPSPPDDDFALEF